MSHRNSISVVIQGGSSEENAAIASVIHSTLCAQGFTNVFNDAMEDQQFSSLSILDLVRTRNPDLLDTPVMIIGQSYEAVTEQEISVHNQMQHSAFSPASMLC